MTVKVQTSSSANFDEVIDLIESKLEVEKLKAGAKFPINYLPKGNLGFMRLAYVVEGSETTGKITAGAVAGDGLSAHEV